MLSYSPENTSFCTNLHMIISALVTSDIERVLLLHFVVVQLLMNLSIQLIALTNYSRNRTSCSCCLIRWIFFSGYFIPITWFCIFWQSICNELFTLTIFILYQMKNCSRITPEKNIWWILIDWFSLMMFMRRVPSTAAWSSNLGIVIYFRGAHLALEETRLIVTLLLPSIIL